MKLTEDVSTQIERSIAKANKKYNKATPAQRRVMIAKDALKQLGAKRIKAACGTYVNVYNLQREAQVESTEQLQRLLHNPNLTSQCHVCARGALLLSAVMYRNDCFVYEDSATPSESEYIKEFSESQQDMIEAAFEEWTGNPGGKWSAKFLTGEECSNDQKRLELILKNIIRNKGTFKPNQR